MDATTHPLFLFCLSFERSSQCILASVLTGGGVVLLRDERRGELSEAETRGLMAERAVAPLVIVVE